MWFSLAEPHDDPDCVKHTYQCDRCGYEDFKVVKL
jgi:hypothetical protein